MLNYELQVTGYGLVSQHRDSPLRFPAPFASGIFPKRGKEKENVFLGKKHRGFLFPVFCYERVPVIMSGSHVIAGSDPQSLESQQTLRLGILNQVQDDASTHPVDNLLITFSPTPLLFSKKALNTHTHTPLNYELRITNYELCVLVVAGVVRRFGVTGCQLSVISYQLSVTFLSAFCFLFFYRKGAKKTQGCNNSQLSTLNSQFFPFCISIIGRRIR